MGSNVDDDRSRLEDGLLQVPHLPRISRCCFGWKTFCYLTVSWFYLFLWGYRMLIFFWTKFTFIFLFFFPSDCFDGSVRCFLLPAKTDVGCWCFEKYCGSLRLLDLALGLCCHWSFVSWLWNICLCFDVLNPLGSMNCSSKRMRAIHLTDSWNEMRL